MVPKVETRVCPPRALQRRIAEPERPQSEMLWLFDLVYDVVEDRRHRSDAPTPEVVDLLTQVESPLGA